MLKAGDLRSRITIQTKTITYNALNEPIETLVNFATLWADCKINQGREYWGAKKLNAELSGIIKIRYNKKINEQMQVVYDGKTYQIIAPPIQDVRRRWTELHVKVVR